MKTLSLRVLALTAPALTALTAPALADRIELGPRPAYLIDALPDGALKTKLAACADIEPMRTDFSIGHRGADSSAARSTPTAMPATTTSRTTWARSTTCSTDRSPTSCPPSPTPFGPTHATREAKET